MYAASFRIPAICASKLAKNGGSLAAFARWLALCSHQPNIMQILRRIARLELQNRLTRARENDLNKGPVW